MPQNTKLDGLYVVVISTLEDQQSLYEICVKNEIPILYPDLFEDGKKHSLWGVANDGIGLAGTQIARFTPKDHILHSSKELSELLK